ELVEGNAGLDLVVPGVEGKLAALRIPLVRPNDEPAIERIALLKGNAVLEPVELEVPFLRRSSPRRRVALDQRCAAAFARIADRLHVAVSPFAFARERLIGRL